MTELPKAQNGTVETSSRQRGLMGRAEENMVSLCLKTMRNLQPRTATCGMGWKRIGSWGHVQSHQSYQPP